MTWNVDWFRNGKRSGEKWEYLEEDSSVDIYEKIKKMIEEFFDSNNESIVCLQEVPYKVGDRNRNHWLYNENIMKDFQNYGTFTANHNCKWAYARTMAISKSKWNHSEKEYDGIKGNKVVQIEKNGIDIMAVHIPPIQMEGKDVNKGADANRKMWREIIEQCKASNPLIILGDFNTDSPENEQYQMLQDMKEIGYLEPEGSATAKYTFVNNQYKTHIDYILVRLDYIDKVKTYEIMEGGVGLSDHNPLIIDIDI